MAAGAALIDEASRGCGAGAFEGLRPQNASPKVMAPIAINKEGLLSMLGYLSESDRELIAKAHDLAFEMHDGQLRKSGEPYILHPIEVAMILASLEADGPTVAAGLLHDVLEDTDITPDQMRLKFGSEVTGLVEGVTKLGKISFSSKEERQAENFRRMFLAMGKDIRVILLKLCDRLHNMRTLTHMKPEKQQEIARETLDIFAPLAHRLGLGKIKWELEDWCLRYLDREAYYQLVQMVAQKREEREDLISTIVEELRGKLADMHITAKLSGRPKHFYSIWQKMRTQHKDFTDLYDVTAIRVLVDDLPQCYAVLGAVHGTWMPIPGRFKDYVAVPKSNLYQSLHTAVMGPSGHPVEIQIRTHEMHRIAEYGIAAHWRYKEGAQVMTAADEKLTWLRQLLDWQNDLKDASEYLNTVKSDLFEDEVFVFSPRGDVIDLPRGACSIDFAYRIHTNVGNRCVGAKVNGRMVPLETALKNGDIVEILTGKNAHPSLDWLKIVATTGAKQRIKQWFKREKRDENILRGREALEREAGRTGLDALLRSDKALEVAQKLNCPTVDDMLAAIGFGELGVTQVLNRIRPEAPPPPLPPEAPVKEDPAKAKAARAGRSSILVDGSDSMLTALAKCCTPVPGEAIRGAVTRGRGLVVHAAHCPNLAQLEAGRLVEAEWSAKAVSSNAYPVELELEVIDRVGLLKDVSAKLADAKVNIRAARSRTLRDRTALLNLVVDVSDVAHLEKVLGMLTRLSDVVRAYRVTKQRQLPAAQGKQRGKAGAVPRPVAR